MKAFAVVAVLLLHQVLGDVNTQLITQASNQFANDLYQKLAQKPDNVLVCPISLHVALTLLSQGASGKTATELATVLKLGSSTNDNVKESYKAVLTGIQDDVLKIANKLYPAAGFKLNSNYLSVARNYFLSDVEGLDYSNAVGAANTINKFVEEKTNNKIHDLISPDAITDLTRLIIVNAIHFQASWKNIFSSSYQDNFRVSPEKKVLTTMMTQTDNFYYKEDSVLQAKILKMDYDKEGYSMLFILPDKEDGLPAVEAKLANTNLEAMLKDLKDTRVEVTIPKFKIEQTLELKEILDNMGLKEMFSSRANLHGLADGDNLYVSDVIQKTFINVHENGTEAAAATVLLETLSANPDLVVFYAIRPFHYYLIHSTNPRLVLFEGRFVLPAEERVSGEGSVSTQQGSQDNLVFIDNPSENGDKFLNHRQEVKTERPVNNRVTVTQATQPWQQQPNQQSQQPAQPGQQPNQQWQPNQQGQQVHTQNPQYNAQNPQHNPQNPQYNAQNPQYNTQNSQYNPQNPQYNPQNPQYNPQNPQYNTRNPQYNTQNPQYNAQKPQYNAQNPQYNTQSYQTQDPNRYHQAVVQQPIPQVPYNPGQPGYPQPVGPQTQQSIPGQHVGNNHPQYYITPVTHNQQNYNPRVYQRLW